jgi:putative MATE family efflux protein
LSAGVEKESLFSSMPAGKAVVTLAIPTVISQVITVIYNMADTFFVGQLGDPNQVAAATLAMPLFMFMTALANLFGIGGASLISRCLGANEREKASHCSSFCVWTAVAAAFLYGVVLIAFLPTLLPILGANGGTWKYSHDYIFWTIGIGAVPTVLNPELAHLVRAEGYSKQASIGVAFGGILNIGLDPLFIFAFRMEITGAAIATMLSNTAAVVYFLCFIHKIRNVSTITVSPKLYTLKDHIPGEVLAVGLPSFIISMMATISNAVLNKIISTYSNEAVAGMGIAKKIDLLSFAIAQGMTQGTLPLIGYNYTSGNRKRMMSVIKTLFFDCLAVSLAGMAILLLTAAPVTRLFIDNAEAVRYGRIFLRIICLACPTTAINFFAITVFQATGKKIQPIILSLLRKGTVDVPLMFLFDRLMGINGIAWATPAADGIALIISGILAIPYLKKLKTCQS